MRTLICVFFFLSTVSFGKGPDYDLATQPRDRVQTLITFTSTYLVTQIFQKQLGLDKYKAAIAGALVTGTVFMALDKLDEGADFERHKMGALGVGIGVSVSLTLLGL